MTAQKGRRRKFSSLFAAGTAAVLAVGGLALAPTAANAEDWVPAITAELADGTPLAAGDTVYKGDQIVVKGSGFDPLSHPRPAEPNRPPITAGDPTGNYVVFGNFADAWRPSTGAASNQRSIGDQRWAMTDATFNNIAPNFINGVVGQRVVLTPEGTFQATLTAKAAAAAPGSYGVFTYVAGGGANELAQELELRLNYIDETRTGVFPKVTAASSAGLSIEAPIRGIPAEVANSVGVYAALIEKGTEGELSPTNQGISADWVTPQRITDGAGTASLFAPKADLDRTKQYEVLVWRAHSLASAETILFRADLNVTGAQWQSVFVEVNRYAGADRFGTNAAVNGAAVTPGKPVFVATGTGFPDALSIGPVVAQEQGTLFLTPTASMSAATLQQIDDADPSAVYIIGGTGAVSQNVSNQLGQKTGLTPERIQGGDRYATSAAILEKFFDGDVQRAFVATGANFPDALSAAAAGGALNAPVVLSNGSSLTPSFSALLEQKNTESLVLVGGTGALSANLESSLSGSFAVERLSGDTRYLTNAAVNEFVTAQVGGTALTEVWVATGANFPDALSAAAPAGSPNKRLVLSNGTCLPKPVVSSWVISNDSQVTAVNLAGGTGALKPSVEALTECN